MDILAGPSRVHQHHHHPRLFSTAAIQMRQTLAAIHLTRATHHQPTARQVCSMTIIILKIYV